MMTPEGLEAEIAEAVVAEREALLDWIQEQAAECDRIAQGSGYLEDTDHAASMAVAYLKVAEHILARRNDA